MRSPLGMVRHVLEVPQSTPLCPQSNASACPSDAVGGHVDRSTLNSSTYTRLKAAASAKTSTNDNSTFPAAKEEDPDAGCAADAAVAAAEKVAAAELVAVTEPVAVASAEVVAVAEAVAIGVPAISEEVEQPSVQYDTHVVTAGFALNVLHVLAAVFQ